MGTETRIGCIVCVGHMAKCILYGLLYLTKIIRPAFVQVRISINLIGEVSASARLMLSVYNSSALHLNATGCK